ncbi:sulfite exporter TauE/SafE family protein [Peredibacter sp. HCB2-198]|uniref:sulfite exporter TauE/SafE family protein n=1 Tax=Peredibacter sp. HCB2-198 TaxID=3383025 RepID=UPI0038B5BEC9
MYSILLLVISVFGGFLGALLGLGGGVIVVSALTLFFGVDIRYAIAASLISIIATSSGAAASFLKDHLTNLRLAVLLEVGTVFGAIAGFFISSYIQSKWLFFLFGGFLLFSAFSMLKKKGDSRAEVNHPWSEKLNLGGRFNNEVGELVHYHVANVPLGLFVMFFAGIFSALLGIGSGIFKVMAMDGAMKVPMKISSATSNFMIGVTATASAGAYLMKGDIRPEIACPVSLGIIIGSFVGARVMPRMPADRIRKIFVVVLVVISIQMVMKGFKA